MLFRADLKQSGILGIVEFGGEAKRRDWQRLAVCHKNIPSCVENIPSRKLFRSSGQSFRFRPLWWSRSVGSLFESFFFNYSHNPFFCFNHSHKSFFRFNHNHKSLFRFNHSHKSFFVLTTATNPFSFQPQPQILFCFNHSHKPRPEPENFHVHLDWPARVDKFKQQRKSGSFRLSAHYNILLTIKNS